jgi:hypothetical protein
MKSLEQVEQELHMRDMLDPVYREGFSSNTRDECPYVFPQEVCARRAQIACIARPLTEEERIELAKLNEEFDKTEWQRWVSGYYHQVRMLEKKSKKKASTH